MYLFLVVYHLRTPHLSVLRAILDEWSIGKVLCWFMGTTNDLESSQVLQGILELVVDVSKKATYEGFWPMKGYD